MRILRVNDDHYVAATVEEMERYALILLNQRLQHGTVPEQMRNLAYATCADEDGSTAYALLQQLEDDVQIIPAKVL